MPILSPTLTAYERQFALDQGATPDDVEDMCLTREYQSRPHDQAEADMFEYECEKDAHDAACGCKECEANLFDGEMDENNDGGATRLQEWREQVHQARVTKAFDQMRAGEQWIRDWIQRTREYEAKRAREAAELQAIKDAYVHIHGTSTWLEYGLVPNHLRNRLLKTTGVTRVDTFQPSADKPIVCRLHISWPLPELDDKQRDAHFRMLLAMYGFTPCTAQEVMLVSA